MNMHDRERRARDAFGYEPDDDRDPIADWLIDVIKLLLVTASSAGIVLGIMAIAEAFR